MADDGTLDTHDLLYWVARLQAGDPSAAEPQLRKVLAKVEGLAASMFRRYPRVGRFADIDDVVQGVLVRLLRALREIRPNSTRQFYALSAEMVRRELLDLIKRYYGPQGAGTNLSGVPAGEEPGEFIAYAPEEADLDRLTAFHAAVERLPVEQREVIGLTYYHDWTQNQIADLFQVSTRTVQRWLADATTALHEKMADRSSQAG